MTVKFKVLFLIYALLMICLPQEEITQHQE